MIPTNGLNILVDPKEEQRNRRPIQGDDLLVRWVVERVERWTQERDQKYREKWEEYRRIWRCEYSSEDKERMVERSRIMPTDLSEAVHKTAAELSDAFFGRAVWFDLADNFQDTDTEDVRQMGFKMREDASRSGVQSAVDRSFVNGCVIGTGLVKMGIGQRPRPQVVEIVDKFGRRVMGGVDLRKRPYVMVSAMNPEEFALETGARTIDEASGAAHVFYMPRQRVLEMQREGIFGAGKVGTMEPPLGVDGTSTFASGASDLVKVTEYRGLVPAAMLPGRRARDGVKRKIVEDTNPDAGGYGIDSSVEMAEAIVMIANDELRLKAVANPFQPVTRGFFGYQHETVTDSFWGRGVVEMGFHPFKALQTEIRARADGLALANYPTVWRDENTLPQTRDDPDEKIIEPGKEYLVAGDPNRAIREFKFSGPDPNSSRAIADYQRMIEQATGSFGFQGAILTSKDTRVQGASVALQSFMRRSKRTAMNIERDMLNPLIEAMAFASMQFIPDRYPPLDFSFTAKGAIGILQRDAERATLIEVLATIPQESPAFYATLRLIIESGPYEQRSTMLAIIDEMTAKLLNPPPPPRDLGGEARLLSSQHRVQEHNDKMQLEREKLKRTDTELLIKAHGNGDSGGSAAPSREASDINITVAPGRKRVKIKRTDDGLVGETEDI